MAEQFSIFDMLYEDVSVEKPIRLIELFAGYGSQAMALERLGADFEHYRVVEFDEAAIKSYNAVHGTDFPPMDVCKVHAEDLGIAERDKFTYLLTYSFPCFTADTMVLTNDGFKKISDVVVGDKVLAHNRKYEKVVRSEKTGHKKIFSVKTMATEELLCTENHKFYVRKMFRDWHRKSPMYQKRQFADPAWVECKDLDKNCYIGYAINQNNKIREWEGITSNWSDGRSDRTKNEISKIIEKSEFWWLIGRYVGDGWHRSQGGIIICCKKIEREEITKVADVLGFGYSVVNERTVDKIHFSGKEIELFVEPFGRGAGNKRIPGFVFDLPVDLLRGFVDGYVSADGSYTQNRYKTSSISKELSYGIAQCVAKVYHTPFSIYKNHRKCKSVIEGREINQNDAWQVVWKTEKKIQDQAFYEDGYIWFPVRSVTDTGRTEDVYDIEVENAHSFTANGMIVHNCTDISQAGQMKGFAEGSGTRSSLLWEVKRILLELKEENAMPDVLLMENVVAIHSQENRPHFAKWLNFLEEIGYTSFMADLNGSDFGIPQNRDRTFVLSVFGNYSYRFPQEIDLETCIEDFFEDLTDEQALKLVVKSPKAMELLVSLDKDGKLE